MPSRSIDFPCRSSGACPACEAVRGSDERYLVTALGDRRHRALASESVSDTLGYCADHGSLLAGDCAHRGPIAQVLSEALDRWSTFLADEAKYGERIEALSFRADRDCPACRFRQHEVAVSNGVTERNFAATPRVTAHRVEALCFPHFRDLYVASPAHREPLLDSYRGAFRRHLAALMDGLPGAEDALEADWISGERVAALLNRVAGESRGSPGVWAHGEMASRCATSGPDGDESARLDASRSCPVCIEKHRALRHWLEAVVATVRVRQPLWMTLPTCPYHAWLAAGCGGLEVAAAAAQYAAAISLLTLHRRLWPFWKIEDDGRVSLPVRRRRRLRARQRGEPTLREALGRPPRCRACERLAVAENRAIDAVLELLRDARHRDAFGRGHGLCMKHFAMTYIFARGYKLRAFLAGSQIARLDRVRAQLHPFVTSRAPAHGIAAPDGPLHAAISLFSEGPLPHAA